MSQPSYTGYNVKGIDLLNYYQYWTSGPTGSTGTGFYIKGASGYVDIGSVFSPYVSGVTGTAGGYYKKKGGTDINTLFSPILTPTNISSLSMYNAVNNIYIADTGNNRIQFIPLSSGTYFGQTMTANYVYTIGGLAAGTVGLGTNGQIATSSALNAPNGVCSDPLGNIYIADTGNNRIQFIPVSSGTYFGQVMTANWVYTIAGLATSLAGLGTNGSATNSALSSPNGVFIDLSGNVYISDSWNNRIQFIPVTGGTNFGQVMTANWVYTIAGLAGGTTLTVGTFNANPTGLPSSSSYSSVSVSSTGKYQMACVNGGSVYLSSNYGTSFTSNLALPSTVSYNSISISSTGQYMLACNNTIFRGTTLSITGYDVIDADIPASGFTTNTVGTYTTYTFTKIGTNTVTFSQTVILGYLVVGGGAGGTEGVGGSGGGVSYSNYNNGYTVPANTPLTITVGYAGKGGGNWGPGGVGGARNNGGISSISWSGTIITAAGGLGSTSSNVPMLGGNGIGGNINLYGGSSGGIGQNGGIGQLVTISDIGISDYYSGGGAGWGNNPGGAGGGGFGGNGIGTPGAATFYGGGGGGGYSTGSSGYQGIVYIYTTTLLPITTIIPVYSGGITYVSNNYGVSFNSLITAGSSISFTAVSISSTGQYQIACSNPGYVYISNNYGISFNQNTTVSTSTFASTSISSTGQYMLLCNNILNNVNTTIMTNTLVNPSISGTGASITSVGSYVLYTFSHVGNSTVTFSQTVTLGYLVVGGGAGGAEGVGGGGGGISYSSYKYGYTVPANTPITIIIGIGGSRGGSWVNVNNAAGNGGSSSISWSNVTILGPGALGSTYNSRYSTGEVGSGGYRNHSGGTATWGPNGGDGTLVNISDIGINSYYSGAGSYGGTPSQGGGSGGNTNPYGTVSPATFYGGGGGGGYSTGSSGYQGIVYIYTSNIVSTSTTTTTYIGGQTYLSNNYGLSFNTVITGTTSTNFTSVSLSSTGQYQLACANPGGIYISTNYGSSFAISNNGAPTSAAYSSVSVSSIGQYMLAAVTGGSVYLSTNYGTSFTANPGSLSTGNYSSIEISSTGQYMLTCSTPGSVYLSKSTGLTGTNGQLTTNSAISLPSGIFTDSNKNIYIADTYNNRIQFVPQTAGTYFTQVMVANYVYTIAGLATGSGGIGTNGQTATSSALNLPNGVYVDSTGNVYIADTGNNRIQFIPITSGTYFTSLMTANWVYTIAGLSTGSSGLGTAGQLATTSALNSPTDVYVDSTGNIYIADSGNNRTQFIPATSTTYLNQSMTANYVYTISGLAAGIVGQGTNNQLATNSALNGETALFVTNYALLTAYNIQLSFTLSVPTTASSTYTFKYYINQRVTGYVISTVTFIGSTIIVNIPSTNIIAGSMNIIYVTVTNTFGESLLVGAPSISLYFDSNGTYIPPPGQPVLSGSITQTANTTNYIGNFTVTGNFTSISWSLTNASLSSTITGSTTSSVSLVGVHFDLDSATVYYNTPYMLTISATGPGGISTRDGSKTITTPPVAPALGTITSGTTSISIPFTLSTGATSYSCYYGTTSSFASASLFSSTVTSSPASITGLTSNTTNYVFLVAVSSYGSSPVASSGQILTAPVAPTNVTTTGSGNYSIDFSFTASTGATSYSAYYNTSNSFATATKYTPSSAITSSPASIAGLNSSRTYYIFLVANSANGSSTYASGGSRTTTTPLQTFTITAQGGSLSFNRTTGVATVSMPTYITPYGTTLYGIGIDGIWGSGWSSTPWNGNYSTGNTSAASGTYWVHLYYGVNGSGSYSGTQTASTDFYITI